MARRPFTPEVLLKLRRLAAQWGKIVARRAFGDKGSRLDVDFDTMSRSTPPPKASPKAPSKTLLGGQTAALGDPQPCPDCGRACSVARQQRSLRTKDVELRQNEPVAHCPDCRWDFFPPRPILRLDGQG